MDPTNDEEQSSLKSSDVDEAGPEQQDLSPQQQAQRELVQQYQQQVDHHPKGKDGLHHYFGGQPLIDPPFWAIQYHLDSELKKFSPIDDQETRRWLIQHNPVYPDNISLKYSTLRTLYFEGILPELWSEAYKRTIWAVTDEQLRRYLRIDYRHLPEWIGYTWHLHFGPRVIYKRALELQLNLHSVINLEQRPFCTKVALFQAARSVINDLCLQLHIQDHYSIIRNPVNLISTKATTWALSPHLSVTGTVSLDFATETYQTLTNSDW